jgi:multimeric flavodoxin WrbA
MKIIVLNGSPKGRKSVTMQYINYIQKKFPQHELEILDIAQKIKKIEKDDNVFKGIINEIKSSDGVLWTYPVYVCLVCSQYKRFIELIFERGSCQAFKDKYTALLSTSIHFFDHTANNYINGICDDLEMKFVDSLSVDMNDLLKKEERGKLILFAEEFFNSIENKISVCQTFAQIKRLDTEYNPGELKPKIDTGGKKVLLLADARSDEVNLNKMIKRFKESFIQNIEVVNLNDIDIKGGCLGCIHCGMDNICVYEGKDGFIDFYNSKVKKADIIIYAGKIKDRYLSSKWKMFFDRGFFNTHQPVLSGKQIGFIISGPLRQIPNLRQILESIGAWQQANSVGIVTDEYKDSDRIDNLIQKLAKRSIVLSDKKYIKPQTFLGVGGRKIFRDDMWGRLRFVFQADHKYYKKVGFYDFPQRNFKARMTNLVMIAMSKIPGFKREFQRNLRDLMIRPYRAVVEENLK